MRCCVPYCENTSENASTSEEQHAGISFHGFPSEEHLHAAWLHALGKQGSHMPHCAVVCSQHFPSDDLYKTKSGSRQLVTGAIPSTVQVCMICLDTDSKLFLMSTQRLEEAYEQLTGYPLYDSGNLEHILCAECVQRLLNFRRFRDKSLRARALMMDLVDKHELITRRHIKLINRTKHRLKSNMVSTTLAPDHWDLHIVEHPSQDRLAELEPAGDRAIVKIENGAIVKTENGTIVKIEDGITVKTEDNDDSLLDDEDRVINKYDYNLDQDSLKCESSPFQYPLCLEESVHEHKQHMSMHLQGKQLVQTLSGAPGPSSARAALASVAEGEAGTGHRRQPAEGIVKRESDDQSSVRSYTPNVNIVSSSDESLRRSSSVSHHIGSTVCSHQPTSRNTLPSSESFEKDEPNSVFTCDSCRKTFKQKRLLVRHIESHAAVNRFTCNICPYSCRYKYLLVEHARIHTGEKPFACKLCEYKTSRKGVLMRHMSTHTGKKPYSCNLCKYKSTQREHLVIHMRTHSGEKPFSCELCEYKSAQREHLVTHMRNHTGEKPFFCKFCEYKCISKGNLIRHMRTHTGEKPFSCKLCEYKSAYKKHLITHMKNHRGEKPFTCQLCEYKSAIKHNLVYHMKTHTGEKPFSCELCVYKCISKGHLVRHMRTHTGEKPFSCELCEYKCISKWHLMRHMRTHLCENVDI